MVYSAQMVKLPNVCTYGIGYLAHTGQEIEKVDARTSEHVERVLAILKKPQPVVFN
ncbi:hypothetical protein SMUG_07310 [Gallibacterium anatis]